MHKLSLIKSKFNLQTWKNEEGRSDDVNEGSEMKMKMATRLMKLL